MSNNCKNYKTDGGDTWVVGGKLKIEAGATVEGLPASALPQLDKQANSTATDVTGVVSDFNSLLAKLQTAGLMKTE